MKPFNLEAAKAGKPLVTRDGRKVTEFHHFETKNGQKNIAVIDGELRNFSDNGFWIDDVNHDESIYDLFLADEEVTVWVNVYKGDEAHGLCDGARFYESKEHAESYKAAIIGDYIGAFPLTIKL